MKIKFVSAFFFSLLVFSATAQRDKTQFHSLNSIGLSNGQSGGRFLMQTVNGLAFNNWFAGIGFGADYYPYKSLPLFMDGRRYFGKKDKGFIYADLGYNINNNNKPDKWIFYTTYHSTGGIYSDFGVGYSIKIGRNSSCFISTGFNYKEMSFRVGDGAGCTDTPCSVDYSTYRYGNGRVALKAGVDF